MTPGQGGTSSVSQQYDGIEPDSSQEANHLKAAKLNMMPKKERIRGARKQKAHSEEWAYA